MVLVYDAPRKLCWQDLLGAATELQQNCNSCNRAATEQVLQAELARTNMYSHAGQILALQCVSLSLSLEVTLVMQAGRARTNRDVFSQDKFWLYIH